MISTFFAYITHLAAIVVLGRYVNQRAPILRLYVGVILSTAGACSLAGNYFPTSVAESLIMFTQAFAVVDMLTYGLEPGLALLQHTAMFYVCRGLLDSPEKHYAPALGIYAIAPTYSAATACFPRLYNPIVYGLIYGCTGILAPMYYLINHPQTAYLFGLHMTLLSLSVYEFGRWISRLRAV